MADRGASASVITAASATKNQPVHLVEAAISTGSVYVTDSYRSIVFGGNTYLALGHLLTVAAIEETSELRTTQASITLSGVDQVWIANVLSTYYIDRKLRIYKGFLDTSDDSLIVDPVSVFDGLMDSPVINEDPESKTCTVTIAATSRGSDFERLPGRHTNDAEQQTFYPGDGCFRFVSELQRPFVWGKGGSNDGVNTIYDWERYDIYALFGAQSSGNQIYEQWPPVDGLPPAEAEL